MEEHQTLGKKYCMEGPCGALFTMVLGFLFIKSIAEVALGLGMFLFACGLMAIVITEIGKKKKTTEQKLSARTALLWSGMILLLALTFVYTDNDTLKAFALLLELVLTPYAVFTAFGNRERNQLDGFIFLDELKACIVIPFGNFGALIKNLLCINKKGGKTLRFVLIGLFIALVPTIVIINLLWADELFSNALKEIALNFNETFVENLFEFFLSVPVSMYLHGMLFGAANCTYPDILTEEKKKKIASDTKCVPVTVTLSAMTPLMLIYLFYCVLHLQYYISAFYGKVPENISTAEYARNGFFELCTVACINLLILLIGNMFTRRNENQEKTMAWKIYATVLSILTIAITLSAVGKMILYISVYGMTVKRLLTIWMMVFLGIVFIFTIILQWKKAFPIYRLSTVVGTVMFMVCVFAGPDKIAAGYNINAYQKGKLPELDIGAIAEMSDQAIPYLIKVAESDSEYSEEAKCLLKERQPKDSWLYQNVQSAIAWRHIKKKA